jgi:hypothetical protein
MIYAAGTNAIFSPLRRIASDRGDRTKDAVASRLEVGHPAAGEQLYEAYRYG